MSYRNDFSRRNARSYNRWFQKKYRRNPKSGKSFLYRFSRGFFGRSRSSDGYGPLK